MSVKVVFDDGTVIEEIDAVNFGYTIGKTGVMTVVLVGDDANTMTSVHHHVRSAWVLPTAPAEPTTAIDISSMPKKKK